MACERGWWWVLWVKLYHKKRSLPGMKYHFGGNFDDLACKHSCSSCENWYWKFLMQSCHYPFISKFLNFLTASSSINPSGKISVDVFTRIAWEYLSNNSETLVIPWTENISNHWLLKDHQSWDIISAAILDLILFTLFQGWEKRKYGHPKNNDVSIF